MNIFQIMNNFQIWTKFEIWTIFKFEQKYKFWTKIKNEKIKNNTKKTSHNSLNVQAYKFPKKKTFPWRMIIGPAHETYHVSVLY
jgi:hypothetical protein